MNKLKNHYARVYAEKTREEEREKAKESFKAVLLEDGFSEEKVNSLIEKLQLKEQTEE